MFFKNLKAHVYNIHVYTCLTVMEGRSKLGSDTQILNSIRSPKAFIVYLLKIYLYRIIYAYDMIYDMTYMWNLNK